MRWGLAHPDAEKDRGVIHGMLHMLLESYPPLRKSAWDTLYQAIDKDVD